jgi:ribosomal protein L16 Arg81 hydroxylase
MNTGEFRGLDHVDRIEAVMQPGDILFVPSGMWHSVRNQSTTIGIRCGFVDPRGMATESVALGLVRFFAARNPTLQAPYRL